MSYSRAGSEKFTIIDDLPDIDDLESGPNYNHGPPRPEQPSNAKIAKFIRSNHPLSNKSGMNTSNIMNHYEEPQHITPMYSQPPPPPQLPIEQVHSLRGIGAPTCIDVADHVANCPVCSRLYNNNDKTIYIISIIVLIIICLLLLKRVLETKS
jgi:hypothetical protein